MNIHNKCINNKCIHNIYKFIMSTKQFIINCGVCWESKCDHWKLKILDSRGIFGNSLNYHIICSKCNIESDIQPDKLFACTKCKNRLLLSYNSYSQSDMSGFFGKNPMSKCITCNFTGLIEHKRFIVCYNCDGTGGLMCDVCNQHGYILRPPSNSYFDYLTIKMCNCDNGYINRCSNCKGRKSIVSAYNIRCHNCNNV
jgi:hypothetical protein